MVDAGDRPPGLLDDSLTVERGQLGLGPLPSRERGAQRRRSAMSRLDLGPPRSTSRNAPHPSEAARVLMINLKTARAIGLTVSTSSKLYDVQLLPQGR